MTNTAAESITTDDSPNGPISGEVSEAGEAAADAGTAGAVFRELVAILAVSLSAVGQAVSMAVLVFSGSLDEGLPRAIAAFVIAGGIVSAYIAMTSRLVPAGSVIQDSPAIVLVAVAASVAARGGPDPVSNVFVMLALTGALTGSMMWLLGRIRFGALVRYMPTTVVGAFMAGTGWLLTKGGLDVAAGFSVELGDVGELFTVDVAKFWVPGVALGVLIWLIGRSDRLPLSAMSMTILASLGVFYLVVAMASSFSAVESGGWLIGPFPDGAKPSIVTAQELADAGWSEILTSFPGIASVVAVSIMVVLLNVTALESKSAQRLDVNAELRSAGVANVLCAPLGVAPGFHGLADTTLIKQLGATRRMVPVAAGALLVVFGAFGVGIIGLVPRLLVGAMLITVGLALLADWVCDLKRSVNKTEQLLSVAIVVVIAAVGILEGIAVGVVAACAVFVVRYSRVDPIRSVGSGRDRHSRVDRHQAELELLAQRADRRVVFELHGYLFFGSIASLEDRIRALSDPVGKIELDALILDFRAVTGIDTSGYELIGQMAQHITSIGALVVMSSVNPDLRDALNSAEPESLGAVTWTATLDEALEVCERVELHRLSDATEHPSDTKIEFSPELFAEFTPRTFSSGELVIEQGATSDGMFVVVKGTMTAVQVNPDGTRHRLRRFGQAALVGEIGLILAGPRTAEIVADSDAEVLWLSADRYRELRTVAPELAFELHEYILRVQAGLVVSLSERLSRSAL